jgi:hypothetical protein
MTRVPEIDARIPNPEEYTIVPKGMYKCKIAEIQEPQPMRSQEFMYHVPLVLVVSEGASEGRKLWHHVAGFLPACQLIYCNRHLFIGMEVDVRVKIMQHGDRNYNPTWIIWPNEFVPNTD